MTSRDEVPDMHVGFLGFFTSCFRRTRQDRSPSPRTKTIPQSGAEDSSGTDDSYGDLTPQPWLPPTARVQSPPPLPALREAARAGSIPQAAQGSAAREEDMDKIKSRAKWLHKSKAKYFSSADAGRGQGENVEAKLNKIFDEFLDEEAKTSNAPIMEIESFEKYLQYLGVDFTSHDLFVLLYVTQATGIGQMSRKGFVEGWTGAYTNDGVKPDLASQKSYIRLCINKFSHDSEYFKKVYRHAFLTGKEEAQKALDKDTAVAFWDSLLGPATQHHWKSKNVDWLGVWKEFLAKKWTRSVNKDMWNQTLVFAEKTMQDETLSFWSENDSWPGVIDDFVEWCREKGLVKAPSGDGMEVDN